MKSGPAHTCSPVVTNVTKTLTLNCISSHRFLHFKCHVERKKQWQHFLKQVLKYIKTKLAVLKNPRATARNAKRPADPGLTVNCLRAANCRWEN